MKSPTLPDNSVFQETESHFSEDQRPTIQIREQRRGTRYNLRLPMVIRGLSDPPWCYVVQTTNISSTGILFVVDQWRPKFEVGDRCQLEVQLMEPNPFRDRVLLQAGGPIVRIAVGAGPQPQVQAAVKLVSSRVIRDIRSNPSYTAYSSVG